jgi:hypothetical protein
MMVLIAMGTFGFIVFSVLKEENENQLEIITHFPTGFDAFILYCSLQNGEGFERSEFIT